MVKMCRWKFCAKNHVTAMIKVRMSRMFVECGEIECWGSWSRKSETNIQSGSDKKKWPGTLLEGFFSQESLLARLIQEKAVEHRKHPTELWIRYCSVWHSLSHPRGDHDMTLQFWHLPALRKSHRYCSTHSSTWKGKGLEFRTNAC